jgi:hypothetical protein
LTLGRPAVEYRWELSGEGDRIGLDLALAACAGLEEELLLLDAGIHHVLHAHIHT